MRRCLILSCEHAGNEVPPHYRYLFEHNEHVLATHKGWDKGALELAEYLGHFLHAPLYYTQISRLLVEANRSLDAKGLFSDFSDVLDEKEKSTIIAEYYTTYRQKIEDAIREKANDGCQVIHLSIHTFTPVMNGETRSTDIGLLYDPSRAAESDFCEDIASELNKIDRSWVVDFNKPYLGTDDGFTTYLRKQFINEQYAGMEIEVNQKYVEADDLSEWHYLKDDLAKAIHQCFFINS